MKFELKFNVDTYNEQMDLLFDWAWRREKEYYKNSQYFSFILLIIGCLLFLEQPSFFNVGIIIISLAVIFTYFYQYFKLKSSYKKLEKQKAKKIEVYKSQNLIFWEFTETRLVMESEGLKRILNWEEFLTTMVKENNLFMFTKSYEPFILGEVEVGKENFKMIVDFVDAKICH